jgi:hypothetical protein
MNVIERVTVLQGHVSPETAYVVRDYPYGYRLRCSIRYWIHTATKGSHVGRQRLITQTSDPSRPGGQWNRPSRRPYHMMEILYLDPEQHVRSWAVGEFHIRPESDALLRLMGIYDQLDDDQRQTYDQRLEASQHYPQPWDKWDAIVAALATHLEQTGQDAIFTNGVWVGPTRVRYYLGDDRVIATAVAVARQRLTQNDA